MDSVGGERRRKEGGRDKFTALISHLFLSFAAIKHVRRGVCGRKKTYLSERGDDHVFGVPAWTKKSAE